MSQASKIRAIRTTNAPAPAASYSQAVVVGPGTMMFVAGQVGKNADGVLQQGISSQSHQTMKNVVAILDAGGFAMTEVVKVSVHLRNLEDFSAFDEIYKTYLSSNLPARTTVGSQLRGEILVEVDVIAVCAN